MDMGLIDLPQSRWAAGTGRQVILKGDFAKIEAAILQTFGVGTVPNIEWVDASSVKVPATADDVAAVMLNGFPSMLHRGMVSGGLTDGRYRENIADVTLDLDLDTDRWGAEKANQRYLVYTLAGNLDTDFTLKAMPLMRVKSQASQIISLGTLITPATGIGYGFTTDELAAGLVYLLTGASRGLMRAITANNNDNTTGGTITYGGSALTLAAGDWLAVLPPATNFRLVGTFYNNASSNIAAFKRAGREVWYLAEVRNLYATHGNGVIEVPEAICPFAIEAYHQTSDQDGAWAHPDFYSFPADYVSNSGFWAPADFCRMYMTGRTADTYVLAYRYPDDRF